MEGKGHRGDRVNGAAQTARDIDGKTDRSNGREHMSQSGCLTSFNRLGGSDEPPLPRQGGSGEWSEPGGRDIDGQAGG
jgi:hypothetical protein